MVCGKQLFCAYCLVIVKTLAKRQHLKQSVAGMARAFDKPETIAITTPVVLYSIWTERNPFNHLEACYLLVCPFCNIVCIDKYYTMWCCLLCFYIK